jgi:hypothetical protein
MSRHLNQLDTNGNNKFNFGPTSIALSAILQKGIFHKKSVCRHHCTGGLVGQSGISVEEVPPPFKKPHDLRKKWKAAVIIGII